MSQIVNLMVQEEFDRSWNGQDVLLITLASLAFIFLGAIGVGILFVVLTGSEQGMENSPAFNLAIVTVESVALIASVYWLGIRRKSLMFSSVGLRPITKGWLKVAVGIGFLCPLLLVLVILGIEAILPAPLLPDPEQSELLAPNGAIGTAIGMFLMAGIAIPFAEELFFRGVLYTWRSLAGGSGSERLSVRLPLGYFTLSCL